MTTLTGRSTGDAERPGPCKLTIMTSDRTNSPQSSQNRNEVVSAILLSLATVLSSWCAFQASQWNGEQYFRIDDENIADNKRLQKEIVAVQRRAGESNYFLYYLDAMSEGNKQKMDFLQSRFPPHMKVAVDKWIASDPLNNPNAARSPFNLPEYVIPEMLESKQFAAEAAEFKKKANEADKVSDNYLLLSIIISTALFFAGLSGVVGSKRFQRILTIIPVIILVLVFAFLIRLPVII